MAILPCVLAMRALSQPCARPGIAGIPDWPRGYPEQNRGFTVLQFQPSTMYYLDKQYNHKLVIAKPEKVLTFKIGNCLKKYNHPFKYQI